MAAPDNAKGRWLEWYFTGVYWSFVAVLQLDRFKNGMFDVGGGVDFPSLEALIEHYKANPMIETSGRLIELKHPEHATTFFPTSIHKRVAELEKQSNDVYGKAGFWEEFEVSW